MSFNSNLKDEYIGKIVKEYSNEQISALVEFSERYFESEVVR